jgi:hypothetical protein
MPRLGKVELKGYSDTTSRRASSKVFIYVEPKGETVMENLFNRHKRPLEFYKALVMVELAKYGIQLEKPLRWNQRMGCSCPCSPGFPVHLEAADRIRLEHAVTGTYNRAPVVEGGSYPLSITIEYTIEQDPSETPLNKVPPHKL